MLAFLSLILSTKQIVYSFIPKIVATVGPWPVRSQELGTPSRSPSLVTGIQVLEPSPATSESTY